MAARVILHVGAPKTGTSYLESIIWGQRDQLRRDGVFLPGRTRRAHDALMGDVRGGVWRHEESPWTWERLAKIADKRDDTVLVSKEMLSGATAWQARRAVARLAHLEVHVVVTTRHLWASLPSVWQQGVKARWAKPFAVWVDEVQNQPEHGFWKHQDPVSVLARWAPGFPADRAHVVTVPAEGDPTVLWRRFASVIDVDPDAYSTDATSPNESLGAAEAELLRRVNERLGDALPMRRPYLETVRHFLTWPVLLKSDDPIKFGLPQAHADWVLRRAQQMADEVRAYPCTVVGDASDLVPPRTPVRPAPDDLDDATLLHTAIDSLARMLVNLEGAAPPQHSADAAGLQERISELEAEIERLRTR